MNNTASGGWTIPLGLLQRIQKVAEHSFNWRVEYPEQVEAVILAAREFGGELGAYRIHAPASAEATGGGVDWRQGVQEAIDLLMECKHGSNARSAGHNARLVLQNLLAAAPEPPAAPVPPAQGWRPAPADVYAVLRRWAERYKPLTDPNPDWLAAAAREIAALPEARISAAIEPAPSVDMLAYLRREREWSERAFGPGERTPSVCAHIRDELAEIGADPGDFVEWIDVVILALDGLWRVGASPEQVIETLLAKQAKNEARRWPDWRTIDTTKPIEHIRDEPAPAEGGAT